jgi:hypothetical protein
MELPFIGMIVAVLIAAVVITGAVKMKLNHRKALKAVRFDAELQVAREEALAKARGNSHNPTEEVPIPVAAGSVVNENKGI